MFDTTDEIGAGPNMIEETGLSTIYDIIMQSAMVGGLVLIQGASPIGWHVVKELSFGKLFHGTVRAVEGDDEVTRLDHELTSRNLNVLLV